MGLLPKCYFARICNCHFRTRDQSADGCGQDKQKHELTARIADEIDSTAKDRLVIPGTTKYADTERNH
jgi:hypothetical protein